MPKTECSLSLGELHLILKNFQRGKEPVYFDRQLLSTKYFSGICLFNMHLYAHAISQAHEYLSKE